MLLQQQKQYQLQQQNSFNLSEKLQQNSPNLSRLTSLSEANKNEIKSSLDFSPQSNNGAINILETLQSKLKQKDGEISQLQKEIQNLERIRESMAKELVNLSNKLDTLQQQLKDYPQLQEKYNVSIFKFFLINSE